MEENPCIICYRIGSNFPSNPGLKDPKYRHDPSALARFFRQLGRHLDDGRLAGGNDDDGTGEAIQIQFEKLISAGVITSCADCSKIMMSYSQLYHQMKSIELLLNWKVWTLNNIMQCAQRVPSRMHKFQERMAQMKTTGDVNMEDIMDLKESLIAECTRKVKSSFPRLKIGRCDSTQRPEIFPSMFLQAEIRESSNHESIHDSDGDDGFDCMNDDASPENMDANFPPSPQDSHPVDTAPEGDLSLNLAEILQTTEFKTEPAKVIRKKVKTGNRPKTGVSKVENNIDDTNRQQHDQQEMEELYEGQDDVDAEDHDNGYVPPVVVHLTELPEDQRAPKCSINPESGKLKCSQCSKEYRDTNGFQVHWKAIHLQIRYNCSLCAKGYSHQTHYERHFRSTHMRGKLIQCEYCNKSYISQSELLKHKHMVHMRSKSKLKYKCKFCTKKFSQSSNASRHKKVCPAVNPNLTPRFECEICLQKFHSASDKATHQEEAHNGKKFMCNYCQQTFAIASYKYIHKRTCPFRDLSNPNPGVG